MMCKPVFSVVLLLATSCALDPDYVEDPDEALDAALSPAVDGSQMNPTELRFRVDSVAMAFPGHVPSQVAAATLAYQAGELAKVQMYLDRVLRLAPDNAEARALRARMAVDDGNLALARQVLDDGLLLRPDSAVLYETDAWIQDLEGNTDIALQRLDSAERLGAPRWRVAYNRGLIFERTGDTDLAIRHYRACLQENDGFEGAKRRLRGLGVPVDEYPIRSTNGR